MPGKGFERSPQAVMQPDGSLLLEIRVPGGRQQRRVEVDRPRGRRYKPLYEPRRKYRSKR